MRGEVSQERGIFSMWDPKPSGDVTAVPWGNPSLVGEAQLLPTGAFSFPWVGTEGHMAHRHQSPPQWNHRQQEGGSLYVLC